MPRHKTIEINGKNYDLFSPTSNEFIEKYITSFGDDIAGIEKEGIVEISHHNVDGYYLSLHSKLSESFRVKIFDGEGKEEYSSDLRDGMFIKMNRKYYSNWKTEVYRGKEKVGEYLLDLEGSRVYVAFESSSLGDTLAWIPYCEEFRKKHNCKLIVSTFRNELFSGQYPEIEFIQPGSTVHDIKALYRLGWFYDKEKEPDSPSTIPLQKAATNILGLDFAEIRPRLNFSPGSRPIDQKYVTIGMSTTAGCKEWSNPGGWQKLINYLNELGYAVAVIQKESFSGIDNVLDWTGDKPLVERMNQIYHSDFYIGLGSGLSWLAWAVNKRVVMISNFSQEGHEFIDNTTRIINPDVCNGCWNNPMFKFDKGDWYWCPEHKGTDREFECQKSITPEVVIEKIQNLIK